jgi:hypothetical protein
VILAEMLIDISASVTGLSSTADKPAAVVKHFLAYLDFSEDVLDGT